MSRKIKFQWNLSKKQKELFESRARFRTGMMGRRFGKNEVGSACVIDYATRPETYPYGADENPVIWWVAPTYRQAYLYGYEKVLEKLPGVIVDDDNTRGSEWGPSRIELHTGAIIEFLSYNNPAGLQGAGVDLFVGDEWAYSPSDVWNQDIRPMLMDSGGGALKISKPLGENHFWEDYARGAGESLPYNDGPDTLDDYESFHATAYDNPIIPDGEIEQAKQTTPESVFRQEYLADPQAGGRLLTLDMLETASEEEWTNASQNWKWHIGVDIGVTMDPGKARENDSDYWAVAVVSEHPRKPIAYVVDVARERGQTPDKAAAWLYNLISHIPSNKVYIETVQAQRWFLEHAREVGLNPVSVDHDRPKEERLTFLSVPFSNGNVKLLEGTDWSDFRNEWASFPSGNHDDQLDALEMALRHCNFVNYNGALSSDPYEEQREVMPDG